MEVFEYDVHIKTAEALLADLKAASPDTLEVSTISECTKLFMRVYPKFYVVNSFMADMCMAFHGSVLEPIRQILCAMGARNDTLFAYLMEFKVAVVLVFTAHAPPLTALNKNPKLPQIQIASRSLAHHTAEVIPAAFQPQLLLQTASTLIGSMLGTLMNPEPGLTMTCCSNIVLGLSKIARMRPLFWPQIVPDLCKLAAQANNQSGQTVLGSPSVKYALQSTLTLLLRIPRTYTYRTRIQQAIAGITFESGLISSTYEQTLAAYIKAAEKEGDALARRQREEDVRRQREEEARTRQRDEEARTRQREEEAKRQREEEARRQREEEARRQREEEAQQQRDEETRRQREEELRRQQEDEARRQREEEARTRQREEEARTRQREEEARRQREEEVRRQRRDVMKRANEVAAGLEAKRQRTLDFAFGGIAGYTPRSAAAASQAPSAGGGGRGKGPPPGYKDLNQDTDRAMELTVDCVIASLKALDNPQDIKQRHRSAMTEILGYMLGVYHESANGLATPRA